MACSRVVPRSTPPSTIKFVPGNALLISGQGEPITTRGSQATMLRAFGQFTDLRTHWGVSSAVGYPVHEGTHVSCRQTRNGSAPAPR